MPPEVDLEGSEPASGPPPGASALSAESIPFELDLESDAPARVAAGSADGAAPRPPAPAAGPAPAADPLEGLPPAARERLLATERRAERAEAAVGPWLAAMQRQAAGEQQAVSPEALRQKLNDPNATTADLVAWVNAQTQQTAMQQHQMMELTARRHSSEQNVRGLTAGEGFDGRTFDEQRQKWTQPVLERLPYLRDVFLALNPENPALIEYGFAALLEISAKAKDDPAQFYRNLYSLLDGRLDDSGAKIQRAARAQAAGVRSARTTGRQTSSGTRATRVDASGIAEMSNADFDRLERQLTGGM